MNRKELEAKLASFVDPEVDKRIEAIVRDIRAPIRKQLGSLTGLHLSGDQGRNSTRVRVLPGLPEDVWALFGDDTDAFQIWLNIHRSLFQRTSSGLEILLKEGADKLIGRMNMEEDLQGSGDYETRVRTH